MAKQPRSLHGKVVVITGGGRGIGAATARALVAKGAKVAIGDVDLETAERTAARARRRHHRPPPRRHRPPGLHRLPRRGQRASSAAST